MSVRRSRILATGRYLPERVVTNEELAPLLGVTPEWIVERTGVKERRYVDDSLGTSDLGFLASQCALERAGLRAQDLDLILFATLSPDMYFPGCAVLVQEKLGIPGIGAIDVRNQCSGFLYALSIADQYIRTGTFRRILVVGAEVHSAGLDFTENGRDVTILFGDGAGAVVVGPSEDGERGILSTHLHADGRYASALCIEKPGSIDRPWLTEETLASGRHRPHMDGRLVFQHAVRKFPRVIEEALEANGVTLGDVDLLIPHQANLRITDFVARHLGLTGDRVYNNIQRYGNTTAGSIPIALDEAVETGRVKEGYLILTAAFGSGFTWASALIRW